MTDILGQLNAALAGRYALERELGRGGMATIFLAEDVRHHRPVAIKVLEPEVAAAIGSGRFLREIESAARLIHPHILPLHDSGEAAGLLYYVMPYVEGESLRHRLERERQLPLADALRIAREVADALDYAHRRGVVHRDIKPENILLVEQHAVLADFGIARAIVAAGGEKLTTTGAAIGTPAYMSPEQAAGSRHLDGRTDLYSLACVLYEMLAGEPPFTGPTAESLVHQHLSVPPRPVRVLRTAVPEHVNQALTRALAKPAADRFATAAEFRAAMGPEIELATRAREEGLGGRPDERRGAPRVRWLGIAAATVIVAIGMFAVVKNPGSGTPHPVKKEWILVADFDGPYDDPTLARTVREVVSAKLDQSAVLSTVPHEQIRLALERAGKPDSLRLTPELAGELAIRGSVGAVLQGTIARVGKRFSITLRVTNVEEDKQLLVLTDLAQSEDALIPVLTRMVGRVERRFREGPQSIWKTGPGTLLESPSTPSFEAYRRFAEGNQLQGEGDASGALRLYREALSVDPDFAAAWLEAASCHTTLGNHDSVGAAIAQALRRPHRLTPAARLTAEGWMVWWRGDVRAALDVFGRVIRLYPKSNDATFALNARFIMLFGQGKLLEALEAANQAIEQSPLVPSDGMRYSRVVALISLGRLAEANETVYSLPSLVQWANVNLALAAGDWSRAEGLASACERSSQPGVMELVQAATARAQATALRGEVGAADAHLLRAEQLEREQGRPSLVPIRVRARILLAQASGRPIPRPEPWLDQDTTASGLITRAYWAAAVGETSLARRLLTDLRFRSTTRLGAHGSAPEFIEACVAARAGHWQDVVALIGQPAREGTDRGAWNMDRIGLGPERWLVAQAYEHLQQPDSAAAFYLRLLASDMHPFTSPGMAAPGLTYPFSHQRLVMLYVRMGRLDEAVRHLAILERDFTRPDPEVRQLLEEARAAVSGARGMGRPEAGRPPSH